MINELPNGWVLDEPHRMPEPDMGTYRGTWPWRGWLKDPEGAFYIVTGDNADQVRERAVIFANEFIAERAKPRLERLTELTSKYVGSKYPLSVEMGEVLRMIVEELVDLRANLPTKPKARMCVTMGHEDVPATTTGTYDDGEKTYPDTAYCAECTAVTVQTGEYKVVHRFIV